MLNMKAIIMFIELIVYRYKKTANIWRLNISYVNNFTLRFLLQQPL